MRISGSRRVVDAWLSLSCGPGYEYRLWKREERERERENGICRTASPIHRGECRRSTSANLNDFTRYRCQPERRRALNKPGNFSTLSAPRLSSKNETDEAVRICFDHFPRFSGNLRVWPRRVFLLSEEYPAIHSTIHPCLRVRPRAKFRIAKIFQALRYFYNSRPTLDRSMDFSCTNSYQAFFHSRRFDRLKSFTEFKIFRVVSRKRGDFLATRCFTPSS